MGAKFLVNAPPLHALMVAVQVDSAPHPRADVQHVLISCATLPDAPVVILYAMLEAVMAAVMIVVREQSVANPDIVVLYAVVIQLNRNANILLEHHHKEVQNA